MKKTLLLFTFFFIFSTTKVSANQNLQEAILNFFRGKTSSYISKDPEIDIYSDNSTFTQYTQESKFDYTHRAIADNNRLVSRGEHIEDVILNRYSIFNPNEIDQRDDKILAVLCNGQCQNSGYTSDGCRPIRVSEVAYFYLTQNSSTSYTLENEQLKSVPFSDQIKNKLNYTYQDKITLAPPDCYQKLYNLIPITPKSNDPEQSSINTTSSEQLTKVEKTLIPDKDGSKQVPLSFFEFIANIFDGGDTQKVKENYYRENQMLQAFTPEKQKPSLSTNLEEDNEALRFNFNKNMSPDSWQEGTIDGDDSNISYNNGNYNNIDLSTFIDGVEFYIFENPGGGRITQRYDLGIVDRNRLQAVPSYLRAGSKIQVDERIIPAYEAMVRAARASGIAEQLSRRALALGIQPQSTIIYDKIWKNENQFTAPPTQSPRHASFP